jgi:hypothetical protein
MYEPARDALGNDPRSEEASMDRYVRNVLIVESDPVERERLAATIEGNGLEVVLCPGPTAPDYTCVGARLGRCPLATDGCVVVIDMHQDGDASVSGTSAEELLDFHLQAQDPVVTLSARPIARGNARVLELRRHPDTDTLVTAVW